MASIALPYSADATTIPASIPTVKDIESSPNVLCNQNWPSGCGNWAAFRSKDGQATYENDPAIIDREFTG